MIIVSCSILLNSQQKIFGTRKNLNKNKFVYFFRQNKPLGPVSDLTRTTNIGYWMLPIKRHAIFL